MKSNAVLFNAHFWVNGTRFEHTWIFKSGLGLDPNFFITEINMFYNS